MTDQAYDAQLQQIDEIMKSDFWDDGWHDEYERRYSSCLNAPNLILGIFAWCAIGILLWEVLRP